MKAAGRNLLPPPHLSHISTVHDRACCPGLMTWPSLATGSRPPQGASGRLGAWCGGSALNRFYLIFGGLIVFLLTAAAVGPFFIDWNGFRPTFERQASEILGQDVHILGDAELRLLPTPRLTFANLTIGEAEGRPLATVEQVTIRMELIPFLSGELAITEMTIEAPVVDLVIDDSGRTQLIGAMLAPTIEGDRVSLRDIVVTDGIVRFEDARTGTSFELTEINTNLLEAPSLIGPWRVEGSLICSADTVCGAGTPVTFSLSTGRVLDDGSFRLNAQLIPASIDLAGTLTLGGTVVPGENGLSYAGDLRFEKLAIAGVAPDGTETLGRAWSVEGGFRLDNAGLFLDEFTFGLDTLALRGSASILFGAEPYFNVAISAPQVDLNTLAGSDTTDVSGASRAGLDLLAMIRSAPPPEIPGHISVAIPSVIMADAALEELEAEIRATGDSWLIETLSVRLPGASLLHAAGTLMPGEAFTFTGEVALSSEQPAILASWWSGTALRATVLDGFSVRASGSVNPDRIEANTFDLAIGASRASGRLVLAKEVDGPLVEAAFDAETFDIDQLIALHQLVFAAEPDRTAEATDPSPRFDLAFNAGALEWGDVTLTGVEVEAAIAQRALTVDRLAIADLDGATINVSNGRVAIDDAGRAAFDGTLSAERLDGIVAFLTRLAPDDGAVAWLREAAELLVPLDLHVTATPLGQLGGAELQLQGTAAGTTLLARAALAGSLAAFADGEAELSLDLDNPDAAALLAQAGFGMAPVPNAGPADLSFLARGIPNEGLTVNVLGGALGPLSITSGGTLRIFERGLAFEGPVNVSADDFMTGLRLVGINLAPDAEPVSAVLRTAVATTAEGFRVDMLPNASSIAAQAVDGRLAFTTREGLAVSGNLNVGAISLGWLMALPLGVDPTPTGDPAMPWSTTAFTGPAFGDVRAEVDVYAARVIIAPDVDLVAADIGLTVRPDGGAIDIRSATLAGGAFVANAAITLADGQALLDGRVTMTDVDLSALVWRRDGRPVAEGRLDLTAVLTATGRSPAGLIASLGGDLTVGIYGGSFAFLNEIAFGQALDLIADDPDIGDIALRDRFTALLDGGRFAFAALTAPLEVAGGYVRTDRLIVDGTSATLSIRAGIDLNHLAVDSTFELASLLDPAAGAAPRPSVGINFRGPLATPERTISIAGLTPYLRYLQAEERDRLDRQLLEQEFFLRLIRRAEADRLAAPDPVQPEPEPEPAAPAPTPAPPAPALLLPPI